MFRRRECSGVGLGTTNCSRRALVTHAASFFSCAFGFGSDWGVVELGIGKGLLNPKHYTPDPVSGLRISANLDAKQHSMASAAAALGYR